MSSTSRPTASEIRAPVPYSTSSSARSRCASAVPAAPAASRIASTSPSGSALGSRLAGDGGRTPADGSWLASPSRTANLWNPRTATTVRPADVGAQRRVVGVALAQRHQELGDRGLGDVAELGDVAGEQELERSAAGRGGTT